jgi:hypothetical protein
VLGRGEVECDAGALVEGGRDELGRGALVVVAGDVRLAVARAELDADAELLAVLAVALEVRRSGGVLLAPVRDEPSVALVRLGAPSGSWEIGAVDRGAPRPVVRPPPP